MAPFNNAGATETLDFNCPLGGSFYVCTNSPIEFVGCCTIDPCTTPAGGKCPTANLRAASFNGSTSASLPPQDCDDDRGTSLWSTCANNSPSFVGCCASNPCGQGLCAQADLVPAKLSSVQAFRIPLLSGLDASSTSSSSVVRTASAVAESSAQTANAISLAATIGVAVGGSLLFIMLVSLCVWLGCRRAEKRKTNRERCLQLDKGGYCRPGHRHARGSSRLKVGAPMPVIDTMGPVGSAYSHGSPFGGEFAVAVPFHLNRPVMLDGGLIVPGMNGDVNNRGYPDYHGSPVMYPFPMFSPGKSHHKPTGSTMSQIWPVTHSQWRTSHPPMCTVARTPVDRTEARQSPAQDDSSRDEATQSQAGTDTTSVVMDEK
jgi:hypothetical protein